MSLARYSRYGFRYFPVVDDWIQYISYQSASDLFSRWFIGGGLYATRPLAGLMDLYVWGKIGLSMSFFIISFVYGLSCYLFLQVFRRHNIRAGLGFVIVYMLLPINIEGTLWLSASTRIVVSLFLISLSLCFVNHSFLFWLFNLLSLFFYEQTAVLSLALSLYFTYKKQIRIIPIINSLIFALYYAAFSRMGQFGYRSDFAMPSIDFFKDFIEGFINKHSELIANGFVNGLGQLSFVMIVLVMLVGIIIPLTLKDNKGSSGLLLGIFLFAIPFTPYLVVVQPLSFRAFVPALVGLGLIVDGIIMSHSVKKAFAMILIPVFLIVGVSEIGDYRRVSIMDKAAARQIIDSGAKTFKRQECLTKTNTMYMQHITNVTESDWAMTGCIRAITRNPDYPMLICEE